MYGEETWGKKTTLHDKDVFQLQDSSHVHALEQLPTT